MNSEQLKQINGPMYKVTGKRYNSTSNFKPVYTNSQWRAMGINLWRGNVWELVNGKWKRIKSVWN